MKLYSRRRFSRPAVSFRPLATRRRLRLLRPPRALYDLPQRLRATRGFGRKFIYSETYLQAFVLFGARNHTLDRHALTKSRQSRFEISKHRQRARFRFRKLNG